MESNTKHYYKELPNTYVLDFEIDDNSKSLKILINIMFPVLWTITFLISEILNKFNLNFEFKFGKVIFTVLGFVVFHIGMIILHELIHGLATKVFTKEKPEFGYYKSMAYCSKPNIYIKKGPKVFIALAPFILLSLLFIGLLILINDPFFYLVISSLFGFHVGGCSGDLYEVFILLRVYKHKKILVNDLGTKQQIYLYHEELEPIPEPAVEEQAIAEQITEESIEQEQENVPEISEEIQEEVVAEENNTLQESVDNISSEETINVEENETEKADE